MRKLINLRALNWKVGIRQLSSVAKASEVSDEKKCHGRMGGWQIHSYAGIQELQFSHNLKKPFIRKPSELLVKIQASSVNPIDLAMMSEFLRFLQLRKC